MHILYTCIHTLGLTTSGLFRQIIQNRLDLFRKRSRIPRLVERAQHQKRRIILMGLYALLYGAPIVTRLFVRRCQNGHPPPLEAIHQEIEERSEGRTPIRHGYER